MKILRMVIGIICCVLFAFIMLQSCVAGVGNAIEDNGELSGSAGFILDIFMLIGGIIAIAGRKNKAATIVAAVFFVIAGIIGISSKSSSFKDLAVYGYMNIVFAVLFVISIFIDKKKKTEQIENKE